MESSRIGRAVDTRVRASRYSVDYRWYVHSKTIGTRIDYRLAMGNISRSGMLLQSLEQVPVPFIENTILEITIAADGQWLRAPVYCLGKVVRHAAGVSDGVVAEFGVNIVQIDNADLEVWENCLSALAARTLVQCEVS